MKNAKTILKKILCPAKWVLIFIPPISFAALIFVFASENTESMPAYICYCMSAYSLTIWLIALPRFINKIKSRVKGSTIVQKAISTPIGEKYFGDVAYRYSISIFRGMTVNFLYVIFRIFTGIKYASVWFISMALYYLVLGILRFYLILCYRRRNDHDEYRCYRKTAWFLFLLNIPMGIMIFLMVRTNSGFSYPGYVIYISALHTFYTMSVSVIHLVKSKKLGSPILSAAKILDFVAAMMSVLGLQTAMITRFSPERNDFRQMMNSITGGFVYGIVIIIAIYMLHKNPKRR